MPIDPSKLRPYQVPHVQRLLRALIGRRAALDASDTGTGKTYCALMIAKAMHTTPRVICPASIKPMWEEVGESLGVPVEAISYNRARGTKWDPETGHGLGEYGEEIPHGQGSYWKWNDNVQLAIFDEVQNCKGLSTLNSKLLKSAKRQFGYLLCLSATAAESITDLNALGFALGLHPGRDFKNWLLRRGCKPDIFGNFPTMPEDKADSIMARLHDEIFRDRGSRMRKAEIPGFPPTQINFMPFATGQEEAKLAGEAFNAAANDLGTWQKSMQELELRAVPQLVELAVQYRETSRVAIFVNYRATVDLLLKNLPGLIGLVDGRQSSESDKRERQRYIKQFQANVLDYLVLNTTAGGVGVNAHDPTGQVERTSFILPNFSGTTLAQVLGRVNRDGGAPSQQFLCGYQGTFQQEATLTALGKLDKISMLNDRELFGFSHL